MPPISMAVDDTYKHTISNAGAAVTVICEFTVPVAALK